MSQGQINNAAALVQGGVLQSPVLFPVNVAEIVRCTCLAIRRRRELMGPICKHDQLTHDVVDVLSRHPGPPNHWTEAWISVQLGCAYAAAGNAAQASTELNKALLAGGQFDHPLASTAYVELGRLALEAGDFVAASAFFKKRPFRASTIPTRAIWKKPFGGPWSRICC